jgi:hypothetical protein
VALGLGVRLSTEELWQVMQAAEARERAVGQAYARLTCPALLVLAAKADPGPWGEAMRAVQVEAARRFQQAHPQVEQVWLDCGHAIPCSGRASWRRRSFAWPGDAGVGWRHAGQHATGRWRASSAGARAGLTGLAGLLGGSGRRRG